jgi:hypothetical protein
MHLSKRHAAAFIALLATTFCAPSPHADERKIDPTFLYRDTSTVKEKSSDLTITSLCLARETRILPWLKA